MIAAALTLSSHSVAGIWDVGARGRGHHTDVSAPFV